MNKENAGSKSIQGDYDLDITCPIVVESLDSNGSVVRKANYKNSTLTLARNEFNDVVLRILVANDAKLRYDIHNLLLHKRFISEGKATIHLPDHQIRILISNCPPNRLLLFLKTLSYKNQATKVNTGGQRVDYRNRLLSGKPQKLTEISPLTDNDINVINGKKVNRQTPGCSGSVTPVSKKRKLENPSSETNNRKYNAGIAVQPLAKVHSLLNFDLTEEQKSVLNTILGGRNVFFTGGAGTGKSFLLKKIVRMLPPDATFITASTGVAATQIGGTTLHSFAGIGSGSASLEQCLQKISSSPLLQQWKKCQHLIVDEISMVQGEYFSKLEKLARIIRKNKQPFGGIQLILCGDFLQLPPVTKENEKRIFCFQTSSWQKCVGPCMELTKVHRQNDMKFIEMLRYIRLGRCTEEISNNLLATASNKLERDGILATHLCTHNGDVNHINEERLRDLPGKARIFDAVDSDPGLSKWFDQHCPVESKLMLKVGTQVMLLKNLDVQNGLVNGARGVITKFENDRQGLPLVKFACGTCTTIKYERWMVRVTGSEHCTRRQLPLKLAWAISIHKAQGMTLDCVEMSLGRVFECGQAYVALSRARNLDSLRVLDFNRNCVRANADVVQFYKQLYTHRTAFV